MIREETREKENLNTCKYGNHNFIENENKETRLHDCAELATILYINQCIKCIFNLFSLIFNVHQRDNSMQLIQITKITNYLIHLAIYSYPKMSLFSLLCIVHIDINSHVIRIEKLEQFSSRSKC